MGRIHDIYDRLWRARTSHQFNKEELYKEITPANINEPDENGYTLLHFAATYLDEDLVKYLLKNGAKANVLDDGHWSPLKSVITAVTFDIDNDNDNYNIADTIIKDLKLNIDEKEYKTECTHLHLAILARNVPRVRIVLNNGANLFAKSDSGSILELVVKTVRELIVGIQELIDRAQEFTTNSKLTNKKERLEKERRNNLDILELLKTTAEHRIQTINNSHANYAPLIEFRETILQLIQELKSKQLSEENLKTQSVSSGDVSYVAASGIFSPATANAAVATAAEAAPKGSSDNIEPLNPSSSNEKNM